MLFCHITTRIEGRKHDNLLSQVGGTGFPHVVAMEASGEVVGVLDWQKRSVDGFKGLMASGKEFVDLRAKAEKGDAAAKTDYFLRALKLGRFKLSAAKSYQATLKKVTPDQKKEIDGLFAGLEFKEVVEPLNKIERGTDPAKVKELQRDAGKKCWEMHQGGRIPAEDNDFGGFYSLILIFAEVEKDIPTFELALKAIQDHFGDKVNARFLKAKQEILKKLQDEKESK
ncbi:MAG TPA: hypothetical protein VJU16_07770 [Planctomycetota bacterium]|nr:hypothetical protein [Planctomycetota bacterium]